jgi:hypothetical protein
LLRCILSCPIPAGPDSWSYWAAKEQTRKMQAAQATQEGGNYGPDSWSYWGPKEGARKLQGADAVNRGGEGGNFGPDGPFFDNKQQA